MADGVCELLSRIGERDLVHRVLMKGVAGLVGTRHIACGVQMPLTWYAGTLNMQHGMQGESEADVAPWTCPAYMGSRLPVISQESWGNRSKDTSAHGRLSGHHPSQLCQRVVACAEQSSAAPFRAYLQLDHEIPHLQSF
jgi:hypothetical protein